MPRPVAAGILPAVADGILPPGWTGCAGATGSQDGCRYDVAAPFSLFVERQLAGA